MYDFATDSWIDQGFLPYGGLWNAGFAHHYDWGLVLSGGSNVTDLQDVVFRTHDGAAWDQLPSMLQPSYEHCMAVVDADRLFVAGRYLSADVQMYDARTGQWTDLGQVPSGERGLVGCGVARGADGRERLVVAGGAYHDGTGQEVDTYDLATGTWTPLRNRLLRILPLLVYNVL